MGFDNLGLAFHKTPAQVEVEQRGEEVRRAERAERLTPVVDSVRRPGG